MEEYLKALKYTRDEIGPNSCIKLDNNIGLSLLTGINLSILSTEERFKSSLYSTLSKITTPLPLSGLDMMMSSRFRSLDKARKRELGGLGPLLWI